MVSAKEADEPFQLPQGAAHSCVCQGPSPCAACWLQAAAMEGKRASFEEICKPCQSLQDAGPAFRLYCAPVNFAGMPSA